MSLAWLNSWAVISRFPRVSGDEPRLVEFLGGDLAFSPRERG